MTNYENMIHDMTPEKLAEIIDGVTNPCLTCAYREKKDCLFRCIDGIEEWMKQEEKDETD